MTREESAEEFRRAVASGNFERARRRAAEYSALLGDKPDEAALDLFRWAIAAVRAAKSQLARRSALLAAARPYLSSTLRE